VTGFCAITSVIAVDRLGKGLRTGPRDALIATASDPEHLGRNFGVHRAMDTAGALIGPLLAFAILAMFPIGLSGFQTIFVFSCAFAVMGVAVLAIAVPDLRRNPKPGNGSGAPAGTARARTGWSDLVRPGLRRLLWAAGALPLLTIGDGFIYLAVQAGGELPASFFPLLFVGTNLAYRLLAIPMGKLADRFGRAAQTVVALARFAASVGFGVLWQVAGLSVALLVSSIGLLVAIGIAGVLLRIRDTGPQDERPAAGAEATG
jgi:hypothetical protein